MLRSFPSRHYSFNRAFWSDHQINTARQLSTNVVGLQADPSAHSRRHSYGPPQREPPRRRSTSPLWFVWHSCRNADSQEDCAL